MTKKSKARVRACPRCGSEDQVRIVYGFPTGETVEAFKRDEIELGGCLTGSPARWHCRACGHDWPKSGPWGII
ncbi:MAG: hypothetical protein ACRDH6_08715 [Actinomycetota bacterium]